MGQRKLMVREFTMDVYFKQCSVNQVFYWQGHTYRKLPGNRGERRTDDAGRQVHGAGLELMFSDDDIVIISKSDKDNLRFKS